MTRPLGVTGVTNPEAATGGIDRQSRDDVRANAPLTMLTLDRIVSLRDYEDFARAFAGIAKALATWTWDGQTRGVFVTIAGADGAEVPETSDTYANLLIAMRSSGDPQVSLRVRSYRKRLFRLTARITRHPDWLAERVRSDVRDALVSRFGFSARTFGQRVALSEVMAVIQTVSGVVGVDVDAIFRTDLIGGSGLLAPLPSAVPAVGSGSQTEPAELLLIDDTGMQIVVE
jgi:predicted phage baseplate assembly protein